MIPTATTEIADIILMCSTLYGHTEGKAHIAIGYDPYLNTNGKCRHRAWIETVFEWPAEAEQLAREIHRASTTDDVYLCPYLMHSDKRAQGAAVERRIIHCDYDGQIKPDKIRDLGAFAVKSGTPGHAQVYAFLSEPVTATQHQTLCKALGAYLGPDADNKISDNDVMRPVGTWNHKPTVNGGEPAPVEWLIKPDGQRIEPAALAKLLNVNIGPPQPPGATNGHHPNGTPTPDGQPFLLADYPNVVAALTHPKTKTDGTVDRSETIYSVVHACATSNLTLPETRWAVTQRADLAEKLTEQGNRDDVATIWLKVMDTRQEARRNQGGGTAATFFAPNTDDGGNPPPNPFEADITDRLNKLRIDREAKKRLEDEAKPPIPLPPIKPLPELLSENDIETPYLVDKIAPAGGRALLSAQYKAGKTHLALNLIRSLADGDPFLGRFDILHRKHNIVLIDDELSDTTIRRWLRQQNIHNTAAVADVIALRGKVAAFNPLDDKNRSRWATRLKDCGCDYLALDCLRPVLDSLGLDENRDAGKFLVAFDALLEEAGILDSLLVQHMGHNNERARGDSRLLDWPDANWRLVRETDEPDSARYFSAYGRDVDVPEGRLSYDTGTGWLTYAAGSRKDAKTEGALPDVIDLLAADAQAGGDGISGRAIQDELGSSEHTRSAIRAATELAVTRRIVKTAPGEKRAKLHRIANPCSLCFKPMLAGQTGRHNSCQQWDRGLW